MSDIRVYEAAKKLNLETTELMRLLEEKGTPVKSPISFISQEAFDDLLVAMTSEPASSPQPEEPMAEPAEEVRKEAAVIPISRSVKGEPMKEDTEPGEEKTPAEPPAADPASKREGSPVISYLAVALAGFALLVSLGLYQKLTTTTTALAELQSAQTALSSDVGALGKEMAVTATLARNNAAQVSAVDARITTVVRGEVKGELAARAASLGELSVFQPGAQGEALSTFARKLGALAQGL